MLTWFAAADNHQCVSSTSNGIWTALAPRALAAWNDELRYLSQRLCFDFLVFDDLSNRDRSFLE